MMPKPVVAAVNGHALAGGCILATSCDVRVMSTAAGRVGVTELAVGVPFPVLPWEIMAARVAPDVWRRLVFLGETFSGTDAVAAGLAEEACEPDRLVARAVEVATRLSEIPSISFRIAKEACNVPLLQRAEAAADRNARVVAAWTTPEVRQRIIRYMEQLGERARFRTPLV